MSDLQKSFAKVKLAGLPPMPPEPFFEEEEETDGFTELPVDQPDDDSSSASSASSTGTIKPTVQKKLFARPIGYVSPNPLIQKHNP
jgi:protein phosphatase methylesterase 1